MNTFVQGLHTPTRTTTVQAGDKEADVWMFGLREDGSIAVFVAAEGEQPTSVEEWAGDEHWTIGKRGARATKSKTSGLSAAPDPWIVDVMEQLLAFGGPTSIFYLPALKTNVRPSNYDALIDKACKDGYLRYLANDSRGSNVYSLGKKAKEFFAERQVS